MRVQLIQLEGKTVAVFAVDQANYIVQTSDGRAPYRLIVGRGEPECRPMHASDIVSRLAYLGHYDHSAQQLSEATWGDFDPLEFERLRQTIERNARSDKSLQGLSDEALALALGMAVRRGEDLIPTVAGILLLGREQAIHTFVPTHEAAFQVIGDDLRVVFNTFYREPLVRLFYRFIELLEARNDEEEFYVMGQRTGLPLYPIDAFREALANALTHRDYARMNAVYIRIDPQERGLVISNPGGFVEGVTLDNLLVTGPNPRNRVLADAFKRLGLVERTGRGIERIFEDVLGLGRPAPDYSGSDRTTVKVVIPGGKADLDFVRLIIEVRDRTQRSLGWPHLLILRHAANEGELTMPEVIRLTQRDEQRARVFIEELVELGLLESKGPKRNRSYHLSAELYRKLGKSLAYTRRRGFSDLQREQRLLTHLAAHDRITRAEVAELCQITLKQAEYLLKKLRGEKKIKLAKRGRNAFYVLETPKRS